MLICDIYIILVSSFLDFKCSSLILSNSAYLFKILTFLIIMAKFSIMYSQLFTILYANQTTGVKYRSYCLILVINSRLAKLN